MASEGPNSPGTRDNDNSFGSIAWVVPDNAASSDNSDTSAQAESATSNYLVLTNFGFSIPSGATIDGIVAEFEKDSQEGCVDVRVRIIKGGTIGSTDKSVGGNWPTGDTYVSHGGVSDTWGETWVNNHINATDFGVALAVSLNGDPGAAFVDHGRITVYYTEITVSPGTIQAALQQSPSQVPRGGGGPVPVPYYRHPIYDERVEQWQEDIQLSIKLRQAQIRGSSTSPATAISVWAGMT